MPAKTPAADSSAYALQELVGTSGDSCLFTGDCLQACAFLQARGQRADLVYIDPPYASGVDYQRPLHLRPLPHAAKMAEASGASPAPLLQTVFGDRLDRKNYLAWLETNLRAIRDVMSERASLYLHLDYHVSHYAKILLDEIFGDDNFRNEIIWSYKTGGTSKRSFSRKHDTILFYTRSADYCFNPQYYRSYQAKRYNYNPKYPELWDEEKKSWYHLALCRDVWEDIPVIGTERDGSERLDYPTQKPQALLRRIIESSSEPGMLVADFFGGSGVCAATAQALGRRFFHSDANPISIQTCRDRLLRSGAEFALWQLADCSDSASEEARLEFTLEKLADPNLEHPEANYRLHLQRYHQPASREELHSIASKRRRSKGSANLHLSESGLELLEWISLDCQSASGCWHSDEEWSIDAQGRYRDTTGLVAIWEGAVWCAQPPQRLKVRDICGRELEMKLP